MQSRIPSKQNPGQPHSLPSPKSGVCLPVLAFLFILPSHSFGGCLPHCPLLVVFSCICMSCLHIRLKMPLVFLGPCSLSLSLSLLSPLSLSIYLSIYLSISLSLSLSFSLSSSLSRLPHMCLPNSFPVVAPACLAVWTAFSRPLAEFSGPLASNSFVRTRKGPWAAQDVTVCVPACRHPTCLPVFCLFFLAGRLSGNHSAVVPACPKAGAASTGAFPGLLHKANILQVLRMVNAGVMNDKVAR